MEAAQAAWNQRATSPDNARVVRLAAALHRLLDCYFTKWGTPDDVIREARAALAATGDVLTDRDLNVINTVRIELQQPWHIHSGAIAEVNCRALLAIIDRLAPRP